MYELWMNISPIDVGMIAALLVVWTIQLYFYARYMCAPLRKMTQDSHAEIPHVAPTKGVSVLVSARNEARNLENYLQALLTQDYPLYEVIVVDDGSEDATSQVIERYMQEDTRLRTTFVPKGAHVGSTKKLALTLAAKAARYDYLLLTDADCRPESIHWIQEMMQPFEQKGIEVVLGYGAYYKAYGAVNRIVRYDTLFNALHYLGAALCGHPYMGVGRNLAYRKDLFFESGGFSRWMNANAGDDDLLVNHIANANNTAVALNPDSITWSTSKQNWHDWWLQKRRHLSVSPHYRTTTKIRLFIEPFSRGLFYLLLIAAAIWGTTLVWLWAALLFVVRLLMQMLIIDIAAIRMKQNTFSLRILWYDICLPLITAYMLLTQPFLKKQQRQRW